MTLKKKTIVFYFVLAQSCGYPCAYARAYVDAYDEHYAAFFSLTFLS